MSARHAVKQLCARVGGAYGLQELGLAKRPPFLHFYRQNKDGAIPKTFVRGYAAQAVDFTHPDIVDLKYGSKGPVHLEVHNSQQLPQSRAAILYLPAGPIGPSLQASSHDPVAYALASASGLPVVKVGYRTGRAFRFPVALHDVLASYDWLLGNLAPENAEKSLEALRVGVVGQLFGGGLGASLSLTECHSLSRDLRQPPQPQVVAAFLDNPIVDWVVPDRVELADSSMAPQEVGSRESDVAQTIIKKSKKNASKPDSSWNDFAQASFVTAAEFSRARREIFSSQNAYFDNFASPIHFFRTPGVQAAEDIIRLSSDDEEDPAPTIQRKSRLRYPPLHSGLELPQVHLYSSASSILTSQHQEVISRMQIAEVTNAIKDKQRNKLEDGAVDLEDVGTINNNAARKFVLHERPAGSLWGHGSPDSWRQVVENVGVECRRILLP